MASANQARASRVQDIPRVVILGGGYGGVYTALGLEKAAKRGHIKSSLISQENFFLFQPMLAEVVSGSIEPPHILNPIRKLMRHTSFHQCTIEAVDTENREVVVRYPGGHSHVDRIPYDQLVVAVGSSTDLSNLPGMAEHAFPFKTLGDAFLLRNHLISVLERVEVEDVAEERPGSLTFVVVGGGYTGVEVAAEINSFVKEAADSYPRVDPNEIKVILIQGGSRILPELTEGLAEFSHRLLERRGIEIRLNSMVKSATAESVTLSDSERIRTKTLVAAIGTAPNRLLDSVPGVKDRKGRVVTDENLAVPEHPGIWAVGDCAAIPDVRSGGTCPPTAQFALREAKHVARNIRAVINGRSPRPFSYRSLGVFVPLGRFSAAAEVLNFKVSGFLAWWLYRTYYLFQLPRLERKLKVVIDWTLELFFKRDIVRMDIARSGGVSRAHYEANEIIFNEGSLARNFYIILSGDVQIFRQQDHQEIEQATLGPGEFFGERSLLRGGQHSASARALSALDVMIMQGTDFAALTKSSTLFGELLEDVLEQRSSSGNVTQPSDGRAAKGG